MLKEIYWFVDYSDEIKKLSPELIEFSLFKEFECLIKHNLNVVETNYDKHYAIITEFIRDSLDITKIYKTMDLVPYVKIRPSQTLCNKEGVLTQYKIR
jgi:hypothetical protein